MKTIKIYQIFLMLSFSLLLNSCADKASEEQTNKEAEIEKTVTLTGPQYKNAGIALGKIEQKPISSILEVNGKIDVPPQNMVSISVPMGGYLKSTKLLPGMPINRGEVIAVMEDQQYIQLQEDYLTTQSRLKYSEKEYQRQKELNQSKASSDKVFQQTESEYESLKISSKALGEKLKLIGINPESLNENNISKSINIYAPISGYVSKVNVNIGRYTPPSEVLFELVNPTDIHLALTVFEKDLDKIYVGQEIEAYTNHDPDKKFKGQILLVGKDLSPERSTEVHCHFDKYDHSLIPGMYMNAEIAIKNHKAYLVPEEALVTFGGNQYLFAQTAPSTFELIAVTTGFSENGFMEIKSGEALKDKNLVFKGAYALLMKMKNLADE